MKKLNFENLPMEIRKWLESDQNINYPRQGLLLYGLKEGYIEAYYYEGEYYFFSVLSKYEGETWHSVLKRLCNIPYGRVDFQFDCLERGIMYKEDLDGWFVAITVLGIMDDGSILKDGYITK